LSISKLRAELFGEDLVAQALRAQDVFPVTRDQNLEGTRAGEHRARPVAGEGAARRRRVGWEKAFETCCHGVISVDCDEVTMLRPGCRTVTRS